MASSTAVAGVTREQVTALEGEISSLKIRLATAETEAAALQAERHATAEAIALGTEKPAKAAELARKLTECETRIDGFRSVIARKQASLDQSWPELRRLEAENQRASRQAEVEALRQKGAGVVARINEKIRALLTADLPDLDAIRDRLAELRDVGGQEARAEFGRALLVESGTLVEEHKLIDNTKWQSGEPIWNMRGDVVLTVRNLWPPKR